MPQNLLEQLKFSGVEDYELLHVIQAHYGSARSTTEGDVLYPSTDHYALKIRTDKGKVIQVQPGQSFSDEELVSLQKEINFQLVDSPGAGIERCILFSSKPVKGYFRSDAGTLRITPPPTEAPTLNVLIGDHPSVIEFPVKLSNDWQINNIRRLRGMLEWTWTLNSLLRVNINCQGPRTQNHWVVCPDDSVPIPTQEHVKWAQEFYTIDGFVSRSERFTEPTWPAVPVIDDNEYYYSDYLRTEELAIPKSFSAMLDAVVGLPDGEHRRFMRAAQWMYVANAHWPHHASSYYIALVAAIESLVEIPTGAAKRCAQCGRDIGPGATQRFQDFVEAHTWQGAAENASKKWLYAIRSRLAHGGDLFQLDEAPWDWSLSTSYLSQREAWTEISNLGRIVLINWLLKDKSPLK
jgi:hypothetical protein